MWQTKIFKTKESKDKFLKKNDDKIQYVELFVNSGYGIEYRKLRFVY